MSAAAILSVAARKAAAEAKKVGAQAMVFVLFLMLAIGAFVNFTGRGTQTQQVAQGGTETQAPSASEAPVEPAPAASTEASGEVVQNLPSATPSPVSSSVSSAKPAASASSKPSASPSPFTDSALNKIFAAPTSSSVRAAETSVGADVRQKYTVTSSQGVVGQFFFDADAEKPFDSVVFTLVIDGKKYLAYPAKSDFAQAKGKDGAVRYRYIGQLNYVTDSAGNVFDYTKLALGLANLDLVVIDNKVSSATLTILPAD
jgi:RNA polymerase sigma-70 factor (ECF subfamily)